MTKKITLLLVIFLIWGCGYQPIYLKKNNSVQKIKTITLSGDQKINKIIINSLGLKEDRNLLTGYSLILKSLKRIDIISKDKNGNPSAYKTFITVDISLAEKETIIKQKEFVSSFTYNATDNKFNFSQYQKNIELNLINEISEKIFIYLRS
ncbi:hypothetical protein OAT03_01490 [Candidatus Pelagibacter sp.]|jgi:hypothetical protein|nr:hypothetical protein [Candidatus Pelagibacter sp.]